LSDIILGNGPTGPFTDRANGSDAGRVVFFLFHQMAISCTVYHDEMGVFPLHAAGMGKSDLYYHDHPTTEERSIIKNQILTSLSSIFVAFHL
jgi:hypothetical protein